MLASLGLHALAAAAAFVLGARTEAPVVPAALHADFVAAALPPPPSEPREPRAFEDVPRPDDSSFRDDSAPAELPSPVPAEIDALHPVADRSGIALLLGADGRRRFGSVRAALRPAPAPAEPVAAVPAAAPRPVPPQPPPSVPVFTSARIVAAPPPSYPADAREAAVEGAVRLVVEVLEDGTAGEVVIDVTSGWRSLDDAAVAAVRSWRFEPAREDGAPCRSRLRLPPIRFRIER